MIVKHKLLNLIKLISNIKRLHLQIKKKYIGVFLKLFFINIFICSMNTKINYFLIQ